MQRTIRDNLTPTLERRRNLAAHMEAQRNAIHAAERERVLRDWSKPEAEDSDSPLPAMFALTIAAFAAWALFGWGVVAIIRSFQ